MLREELDKAISLSMMFTYIILGFIGLGLVVGIATPDVISICSAVERRQLTEC